MFEARKLFDAALDVWSMRLVFFLQVAELGLQFGAESTKAARPAMMSADDSGMKLSVSNAPRQR